MPWTGFLVVEATALIAAAPAAGVLVATSARRCIAGSVFAVLLVATAAAIAFLVGADAPAVGAGTIFRGQLVAALAAAAMAASGAHAATIFRDPLDAAALVTVLWLVAGAGPIAAGPLAADLPTSILDAAILASPLCAAVSAADVDLFRLPSLYGISPIAHVRFDYPSWHASALFYFAMAAGCSIPALRRAVRSTQLRSFEGI